MNAEIMHNSAKLFDEYGRCIPDHVVSPVNKESRRYFIFDKSEVNYTDIYNRIKSYLDPSTNLSLDEFETRAKDILKNLNNDSITKNITKGVGVPFFLPNKNITDIGTVLVEEYLNALQKSFKDQNPKYEFVNHCKEILNNKLIIAHNSRHEKLLNLMKEHSVVGYFYPCLMEYSLPAAIERIESLPNNFILAGGIDTCAAFIGSPNLLLRTSGYPPLIWMSSLKGEKDDVGYHLEAYGYNLTFNRRAHLNNVAEYWAHALVIIG